MERESEEPVQSLPGLMGGKETGVIEPSTNGHSPPYDIEAAAGPKKSEKTRFTVPVILFVLTSITTLLSGSYYVGGDPFRNPADLALGVPFAFTLLSILFCHEMGHYLTSLRYGVHTSPPYFIPGPWGFFMIGTFGAFIRIKSPIFKKNALLDIGAAGPIAGFIVAVIASVIGLKSSEIVNMSSVTAIFRLGDPLIFTLIQELIGKVPPEGYDIMLGPVGWAGWIGFFLTALNLLPAGQLDGGHISYAILGKKSRYVSLAMVLVLFYLGLVGWKGWFVWAVIISVMGLRHPPVVDEDVPLDTRHRLVALSSIIIFILTFMPNPFMVGP
ncbi:site-2 protease family protein [Nitrospira defluvii]|nr:site-2 protease family protein [Nitrospira defluvii]